MKKIQGITVAVIALCGAITVQGNQIKGSSGRSQRSNRPDTKVQIEKRGGILQKEMVGELNGDSQYLPFAPDGIPFIVADTEWKVHLRGNHRAVVQVTEASGKAVQVVLPWRRPDLRPETKKIIVVDAKTDKEISNVKVLSLTSESGTIVFEPVSGKGVYYIYYLPYRKRTGWGDARYGAPWNDYVAPAYQADSKWATGISAVLPQAKVLRFESRSKFDAFTPMGLVATASETERLLAEHPGKQAILFPEDRAFPIRQPHHLPARWTKTGAAKSFSGVAARNEYYVWQIGAWAARAELKHVKLSFSDLVSGTSRIAKKEITCFNQEGINWDGKPITFDVNVPQGKLQALWCGVQIPKDAPVGTYQGKVVFSAENVDEQTVPISIKVTEKLLADQGDGDLWRHARLRWLNSRIGDDNHPVAPFRAMDVKGRTITATDKMVQLAPNGLPASIEINGKEVLAHPIRFTVVFDKGGSAPFTAQNAVLKRTDDGLVSWTSSCSRDGIHFKLKACMEYDGYLHYDLSVKANKERVIRDIRLETDYTPYASAYFTGIGYRDYHGGACPEYYKWYWKGHWDSYWMGNALAGLHTEYRGGAYHGPLINDYKPQPPRAWANCGKGAIELFSRKGQGAKVVASTGMDTLTTTPRNYEFALMITPVRPVNSAKHFSERYCHGGVPKLENNGDAKPNIFNIHHASPLNPVINYPFIVRKPLTDTIDKVHQSGGKVKLYYTIRELSNHAVEIYALKSLNHEIYAAGPGYFNPWHCEHLVDDYQGAWFTEMPGGVDAALKLSGLSRWVNYYLEGLRWMFENYKLDGIYMDDVSFDRPIMKRIRKIIMQYRPDARIDLHSNAWYSSGPANQYAGFFAYVDRLWFGEGFGYNAMQPDEWFVCFSGIPFGLMSDMLQDGGNRFLGMVYGATARYSKKTVPCSPIPVWNLWKSFGITDAKMVGYWDEACPVQTSEPDVKATAYVKPDRVLIAVGNFSRKEKTVRLTFDWKALGMDSSKAVLTAPAVQNFQAASSFGVDENISIKPKQGWLLILSEK